MLKFCTNAVNFAIFDILNGLVSLVLIRLIRLNQEQTKDILSIVFNIPEVRTISPSGAYRTRGRLLLRALLPRKSSVIGVAATVARERDLKQYCTKSR